MCYYEQIGVDAAADRRLRQRRRQAFRRELWQSIKAKMPVALAIVAVILVVLGVLATIPPTPESEFSQEAFTQRQEQALKAIQPK